MFQNKYKLGQCKVIRQKKKFNISCTSCGIIIFVDIIFKIDFINLLQFINIYILIIVPMLQFMIYILRKYVSLIFPSFTTIIIIINNLL